MGNTKQKLDYIQVIFTWYVISCSVITNVFKWIILDLSRTKCNMFVKNVIMIVKIDRMVWRTMLGLIFFYPREVDSCSQSVTVISCDYTEKTSRINLILGWYFWANFANTFVTYLQQWLRRGIWSIGLFTLSYLSL